MLYHLIVAAGLICFMLNLILNLRSLKIPCSDAKIPESVPLVSILIPARNEEANIENCLQSLRKQDYPNFEIIVLDDDSSDNTANVVNRIAVGDNRIQLIKGEPLAEGWAGKPFACYQLARRARGSWLLFVDADTTHAPNMLRSILALAIGLKVSLLSGFPRQLATSLPQRVAIPVLYFVIMCWLPLWWLQRSKNPKRSLAIGRVLLFSRDEYWRIGGHEAVKSRILEDVWVGVEITRQGGKQISVDLSPVVSCHMYRNVGAMWEGFVKWIYSVAALSRAAIIGLLIAGYVFFLAPFYWLWNEFFATTSPSDWRAVIIFQVAIIIFMRWLVDSHFKEPAVSAPLHPFGFSFLISTGLYAAFRQAARAGVRWKSRLYDSESRVD